jgi:hypothetical protein
MFFGEAATTSRLSPQHVLRAKAQQDRRSSSQLSGLCESRRVGGVAYDLTYFFVVDYLPVTANQNPSGFPGRAGDVTRMIGAIH